MLTGEIMKKDIKNEILEWATNYYHKVRKPKTKTIYDRVGEDKYNKLIELFEWRNETINNKKNNKPTRKPPLKKDKIPGQTDNRNTRSFDRSAIKYFISKIILDNPDENCMEHKRAVFIKNHIVEYAKENFKNKCNLSTEQNNSETETTKKQNKKTKRKSLKGLPKDWRQTLVLNSKGTLYEDQIHIMTLCGCRPAEFESGINVVRTASNIEIHIIGAKFTDINDSGQPWRIITINIDNPLIGNLKSGVYFAKANAIGSAVSRAGIKVIKRKKNKISAYTLRHAYASDLRASNLSRSEISAALGHQSEITQSMYGGRSKNPLVITASVKAALPVRPKTKTSKLIDSKMSSKRKNKI